jgi:hypothetical protein
MEIHKKIILIITIIVTSIVLYRLWVNRIKIEKEAKVSVEPYSSMTIGTTIDNKLALNQYFIKASWNTAYTGSSNSKYASNAMNVKMIIDVLNRGCRFLDFEIYAVLDAKQDIIPVVGYSTQPHNNNQMECNEPVVNLSDVFLTIANNAFSTTNGSPNPKDPLFIQLRIKSSNMKLYQMLPNLIQNAFNNLLNNYNEYPTNTRTKNKGYRNLFSISSTYRREKISPDEIHKKPLSFFNGKIIMIADLVNSDPIFSNLLLNKNSVDYSELVKKYNNIFTDYTVQDFTNPGINSMSNNQLAKLQYRPPTLVNNGITTVNYMNCETCENTIIQFTQSFPDFSIFNRNNSSKTDVKNFITNYGVNILPFRFYIDDNNLADYERLFNKLGNCAFIKMSSLLHHYKKHSK